MCCSCQKSHTCPRNQDKVATWKRATSLIHSKSFGTSSRILLDTSLPLLSVVVTSKIVPHPLRQICSSDGVNEPGTSKHPVTFRCFVNFEHQGKRTNQCRGTSYICEMPGQLQGSKTPKPENHRKKLKNYPPDPDPKFLEKSSRNTKNTRKIVFFEYF